jgi:hypothetical protein
MSYSPEQFASELLDFQAGGGRAALLIGFDGGSALLDHPTSEAMLENLKRGRDSPGRIQEPGPLWGRMSSSRLKQEFLEKHTRIGQSPDNGALHRIAGLLEQRYVRAVVATDADKGLQQSLLRKGLAIKSFECSFPDLNPDRSGSKLDILGERIERYPVFIDGGEVLLQGFVPSIIDLQLVEVRQVRNALREFLKPFAMVLCWGWCEQNIPLKDICDEDRTRLFLLGEYTWCSSTKWERPYEIVEDPQRPDKATTGILESICKFLPNFPPEPTGRETLVVQAAGSATASAEPQVQTPMPARLLWASDTLRAIEEQAKTKRLSIIGVEGQAPRHELAQWLLGTLRNETPDCHYRAVDNVWWLNRYIMVLAKQDRDIWIIAELNDTIGTEVEWGSPLTYHIRQWIETEVSTDFHMVLLTPVAVPGWLSGAFQGDTRVYLDSLYADSSGGLVAEHVGAWLARMLKPRTEITDDDIDMLAGRMVEDALSNEEEAVDWLHEALELWEADIRLVLGDRASRDRSQDGPDTELGVDLLLHRWANLVDRYRNVDQVLYPDFDLEPMRIDHPGEGDDPDKGSQSAPVDLDPDGGGEPSTGSDQPQLAPTPGADDVGAFDLGPITPIQRTQEGGQQE